MEDTKIITALYEFARRIVFLECQTIALQSMLARRWNPLDPKKARQEFDEEFDHEVRKVLEDCKEFLSPTKSASERVEEFLRSYKGPKQ